MLRVELLGAVSGDGIEQNDSERVSTAVLQFPNVLSGVQLPCTKLFEIRIWLSETYCSPIYGRVSLYDNCSFFFRY